MRFFRAIPLFAVIALGVGVGPSTVARSAGHARSTPVTRSRAAQGIGSLASPLTRGPASSGGGGQISYTTSTGLWLMDANGGNRVHVPTPGFVINASWTGDGSKVLWQDSSGLYFMKSDGSDKKQLDLGPGVNDAAISPNGQQVAFAGSSAGLYVQNVGSKTPVRYGSNTLIGSIAWSPDGKKIAFSAYAFKTPSYFVDRLYQVSVAPSGRTPAQIPITVADKNPSFSDPSFTPDGKRLVFLSGSSDYHARLCRVSLAGGRPTEIPTILPGGIIASVYNVSHPRVSPDGTLIAFNYSLTSVVTIPISGGKITDLGTGAFLAWRPNPGVSLSGTLWVTDCTDHSCSRAGAVGDKLGVSGTDSRGNKISASATSAAGGRWFANVPAGNYTITPAAGFMPDSKTVVAQGNVAGIDFATCGALGSSASPMDIATQKMSGRPDAASGQKGCPDAIDWKLLDRTGEVPGIAAKSDLGMLRQKDIYAPFSVHLYLSVQGSRVTQCAASSVWKWAVTGKPAGARVLFGPSSPGCSSQMIVDKQGPYRIVARRYVKGNLRQTVTYPVQVHDLLIIAMGDSNGSGEGTPEFWFNQCNRGSASYQYQAAGLLESQSALHTSATFVSASCSGARVAHLVSTPYAGINPGTPLPAQIKQIQDALRPPAGQPRRKVDAAVISIGINDLAFGPILQYCVKIANLYSKPCEDILTRAEPASGPVNSFVADSKSKTTLGDLIDQLLKELPSKYDQLSAALAVSRLVQPSQVHITQYPSFAYKNDKGDLCTSYGSGVSGLQDSTWKWLALEGAKLNNAVLYAAAAHGWNAVQVPRQLFFGHGYCTGSSAWFVGISKANLNKNPQGAFHPTARGAHVTAVLTLEHLCPLLGDKRFCTKFPTP